MAAPGQLRRYADLDQLSTGNNMAEVFISFIHEEERIAKAVHRFLKKKLEKNVFLSSDKWQVFAGELWLDRIRQELSSAKVVILLISHKSVLRPWVNFEAGAAWLTNKVVIPVCFADMSKEELPKPYSGIQAVSLRTEAYYFLTSVAHHLQILSPVPTLEGEDEAFRELWTALDSFSYDES